MATSSLNPSSVAATLVVTAEDFTSRSTLARIAEFASPLELGPIDGPTAAAVARKGSDAAVSAAMACTDPDWLHRAAHRDKRVGVSQAVARNPHLPVSAVAPLLARELERASIDTGVVTALWSKLTAVEAVRSYASPEARHFRSRWGATDALVAALSVQPDLAAALELLRDWNLAPVTTALLGRALTGTVVGLEPAAVRTLIGSAGTEVVRAVLDQAAAALKAVTGARVTGAFAQLATTIDPWEVHKVTGSRQRLFGAANTGAWSPTWPHLPITPEAQEVLVGAGKDCWRRWVAWAKEPTSATVQAVVFEATPDGIAGLVHPSRPAWILNWVLESCSAEALRAGLPADIPAAVLHRHSDGLSPVALVGLWANPLTLATANAGKGRIDPAVVRAVLDANSSGYVTEYATAMLTHSGMARASGAFTEAADIIAARVEGLVPRMLSHPQPAITGWVARHATALLAGRPAALESFCALAPSWTGTLDGLVDAALALGG